MRRFCLALLVLLFMLWLTEADQTVFLLLHHDLPFLPPAFWRLLSLPGEPILAVSVLLVLSFTDAPTGKRGLWIALLAMCSSVIFKSWFDVLRPPLVLPGQVHLLDVLPANASFPSGHAIFAAAMLAAIVVRWPKCRLLLWIGLPLVMLSRIAIGVHWPSDVLAGAILGLLIVALVRKREWTAWPERWRRRLALLTGMMLSVGVLRKWLSGMPNEASVLACVLVVILLARLYMAGICRDEPASER